MSVAATAVQDLRLGLGFAAKKYRDFAEQVDRSNATKLILELADERAADANALDDATLADNLVAAGPTIDEQSAAQLLGLGASRPSDAAAAMYRVQRAENELGRMADQLASFIDTPAVHQTLANIGHRIDRRKAEVREMRRHVRRTYSFGIARSLGTVPVDGQIVDIWFGTNRAGDAARGFSTARADTVTYGRCNVFVPAVRRVGSLGSGVVGRILHGDDRIKVQAIRTMSELAFWSQLHYASQLVAPTERHGLVFLHGYKTKFEEAARRTAQLKVDLSHAGPAAFFSWPSLGSGLGYTSDEAAIEGSEAAIQNFLMNFAERSGADAVHIIAHSMGNRGLLRAMSAIASLAAAGSPVRFGQIFLAAPDVDTQLFRHLATAYGQVAERATLYVTDNDQAIGLSRRLHAYPRAGLTPPVVMLPGIDTIDASGVNLGMWGHSYAAEMRPVLADIYELMRSGTPPQHRFGLLQISSGRNVHWRFAR